MQETYAEFITKFLKEIKHLLSTGVISFKFLQDVFQVKSDIAVKNILEGRKDMSLASFRLLCNHFDLWPEWNLSWNVSWIQDGKIETFFQFFGPKEALEQNLINHAEKHELTLTKDLVNGTYFVDKNQLYIQRVKKMKFVL